MRFKPHRTKTKWSKSWLDTTKQYRITCIKGVDGVKVHPHYHALVKIKLPNRTMWDFAMRHGPYKTRRKAIDACEQHKKLWEKALTAETKSQLLTTLGRLPIGIPEWVAGAMQPEFVQLLMQMAQ